MYDEKDGNRVWADYGVPGFGSIASGCQAVATVGLKTFWELWVQFRHDC